MRVRDHAQRDACGSRGDSYVITGQKIFISRVEQSDLMLLLARTTPIAELKTERGLSVFLVDLRNAVPRSNGNASSTDVQPPHLRVFFNEVEIPAENLIGDEGKGFRYIIDGWNAERILIASEAIGDGHYFVDRASKYAGQREVFGRLIGSNQGVQFPIAQAHAQVEAAT